MSRTIACTTCGRAVGGADRFCPHCGAGNPAVSGGGTRGDTPASGGAPSLWGVVADSLRAATRGEYDIAGELGHGGMAAVYLAHDIALDKKVAIKVMAPTLMADPSMVERFLQEARTVAKLEHPNIVTVHAARQTGGLHFFVMKYIEGRELETILQQSGALPLPIVQVLLYQVAGALHYAHVRGVIHRDVKPSNIMVDVHGNAVVTDFGIAKLKGGQGLTMHGAAIGTPQYMSPEQCLSRPLGPASDQYSLGVVTYHMLTGSPPFAGHPLTVMRAQVEEEPPEIHALREGSCPADVHAALRRMLAKTPEARFADVMEAVGALGGHPAPPDDPLRAQLVRLVRTADFIPATEVFTTPMSPSPSLVRGEKAAPTAPMPPPTVPEPPPTTPVSPPPSLTPPARVTGPPSASPPPTPVPATVELPSFESLKISRVPRSVRAGKSFRLRALLMRRGGTGVKPDAVTWESSDPSVVDVDGQGNVRAVAPGAATITASAAGLSESADVTVAAARRVRWRLVVASLVGAGAAVVVAVLLGTMEGEQVVIEPAQVALEVGGATTLNVRGLAAGVVPAWTSGDTTIAVVDETGRVVARRVGTATVFARMGDAEATVTVTVERARPEVAQVRVTPAAAAVEVGQTVQLSAVALGSDGAPLIPAAIGWRSEDESRATVSSEGLIEGRSPGTVRIVAASDGVEAAAQVRVVAPQVAGTPRTPPPEEPPRMVAVDVQPPEVALAVGEVRNLAARGRDGRGRALQARMAWRSNDAAVATVSASGAVTGVGEGSTLIVARSDGVEGWATVTVAKPVATPVAPPVAPPERPAVVVAQIVTGSSHSCARTSAGQLWCWGGNESGQIRSGAGRAVSQPVSLEPSAELLTAGALHTCALRDGQAVCWGNNGDGQLGGDDRNAGRIAIAGMRFTTLSAGREHTCGIASGGRVHCWGKNDRGQVGDGSTSRRSQPTPISDRRAFTALTAGARHTCGLRQDKLVMCWGDNWSGQVGSSMIQTIPSPTDVSGDLRFVQLSAGDQHTCGATDDAKVRCWGDNAAGQLGDGSRRQRTSPVLATSKEAFAAVAAGGEHTCALTRAGRAWCWGRGREGQLGDGARQDRPAPSAVRSQAAFVALAAGEKHTCGLTQDRQILCWGINDRGQLGKGDAGGSATPVPVAEFR